MDAFRQNLLGQIGRRLNNLSLSHTFSICMFLDPRFKLYFADNNTAEEAKKMEISLVASRINKPEHNEFTIISEGTNGGASLSRTETDRLLSCENKVVVIPFKST